MRRTDFGPKYHAFAVTNGEIRGEVMKIFDQTFLITYALLAVAIVVAVLGVINTLAALILERKRDLALLRVLGMSMAEVRRMLVLESSVLGLTSTAAGLAMGYVLSWILIYVINKQSFGWTIAFHTPVRLIAAIAGGDVHRVAAGGTRSIASSATDRSRECDEGGTSTSRWSRNPLCRVGLLVEPLVAPLPFFCRKPGVVSNRHARYLSRWRVIPMQISGKRVREWRELQGWTQSQMGAFAELDVRTVQRVESHGRGSLETLKALAATLGVDISQFSALEASDHPGQTKDTQNNLLGTYGPLLASLTDALKATHHWRQHFNDLFIFRNSFFRDPDPPLFQTVEQHAHLAATVSLQLHQDIAEGIRQLKALNHEVRSFGGHIRGLSRVGYHVAPEVQQEGAAVGNRLCDHVEFYLGRARKELVARVYPHQAA